MQRPPPKPRRYPDPHSFAGRADWARELGRCDAIDSVLWIWEENDAELAVARTHRQREIDVAKRSARAGSRRAAAVGALALLALAIPLATLAHLSTPLNATAKAGTISAALQALQHDDTASVRR